MIDAEGLLAWATENPPLNAMMALRMNMRHRRCDQCRMNRQVYPVAARTQEKSLQGYYAAS